MDLRTGELLVGLRGDRITQRTAVTPVDNESRRWLEFIELVQPEPVIRHFLQVLFGMMIAPSNPRLLPLFLGLGANGKTQAVKPVDYALAVTRSRSTCRGPRSEKRHTGRATPELARPARKALRLRQREPGGWTSVCRAGQAHHRRRRHHGAVPQRQPIHLHVPTHTVVLSTNHKPRVSDTGPAIWDRLILVDWNVIIPPPKRIADYWTKLVEGDHGPGLLRWVINGAAMYMRDGLTIPDAVSASTKAYQDGEDVFGASLDAVAPPRPHPAAQVARGGGLQRRTANGPCLSECAGAERTQPSRRGCRRLGTSRSRSTDAHTGSG